jgi:hypothetical protein
VINRTNILFDPPAESINCNPLDLVVRNRRFRITAESPESISFLRDTFYPEGAFRCHIETDPVCATGQAELEIIDRVLSEEAFEDLANTARVKASSESLYAPTRNEVLPKYDVQGGELFLDTPAGSSRGAVFRVGTRLIIVGTPGRQRKRRLARLIRVIGTRLAELDGALCLHAASFVYKGSAFLLLGDAGSGKSTLSVAIPRVLGAGAWLGNDRAHLDGSPHGYITTACPLPLAINKGTLQALRIADYASWHLYSAIPEDDTGWDKYDGDVKLKLSPAEVERYMGIPVATTAPLGGIILPSIRFDGTFSFRQCSVAEALHVIRRNCLSLVDNLYGDDWLRIGTRVEDVEHALSRLVQACERLPLFSATMTRPEDTIAVAEVFGKMMQ